MTKRLSTMLRSSALAGSLLLGLAACGKNEPPPPTPDLPPPGVSEKIAAQAEVKASSGPIEFSFLLHKTQIKLGESLWHQLRVRNVGKLEITIVDPAFYDPWEWLKECRGRFGIYIEVLGPDGKPLTVAPHPYWGRGETSDKPSGLLDVQTPEEKRMLDNWTKRGVSPGAIRQKLVDYNLNKQYTAEARRARPKFKLLSGETVSTKSWFYYSEWERFAKRAEPHPVGDFAELEFFDLDKPGKYKVRAVYDLAPTLELMAMRGRIPIGPDEVLVRTPWIEVTVLP